jgi:hypothetical protein
LEGNQVYYWRVRGLFSNPGDNVWSDTLSFATASFTSVQEEADKQALRISCHPNPVSGMADISMYVPESENITLSITDVRGKEVLKILDNALLEKGEYRYVVNTSRLPSGVYIMRMSAGRRNTMQRIVIIQ